MAPVPTWPRKALAGHKRSPSTTSTLTESTQMPDEEMDEVDDLLEDSDDDLEIPEEALEVAVAQSFAKKALPSAWAEGKGAATQRWEEAENLIAALDFPMREHMSKRKMWDAPQAASGTSELASSIELGSVMAVLWTQVASVAGWVCQPTSSDHVTNDQILQLQSALDEMRLLLNHEQRVSQELKAQVRDERRRAEMLQREMQDKLELQDHEMKSLLAELETAKAALQQKKNEFPRPMEETSEKPSQVHHHVLKQRECETELLAALLEHATKQATACPAVKKESTALQQLRSELEVAQGKASEAQEATEELRQQLQQEKVSRLEVEHLLELQRESLVREVHHRKTFEAQVAEFLQLLGQRNALHAMLIQWFEVEQLLELQRESLMRDQRKACEAEVADFLWRVISRKARAELQHLNELQREERLQQPQERRLRENESNTCRAQHKGLPIRAVQYVPHLVGEPFPFPESDPQGYYKSVFQKLHQRDLPLIGNAMQADTLRIRPWPLAPRNRNEAHAPFLELMRQQGICKLVPTFHLAKHYAEMLKQGKTSPETNSDSHLATDFIRFGGTVDGNVLEEIEMVGWSLDLSLDLFKLLPLVRTDCTLEPKDESYSMYKSMLEVIVAWVRQQGIAGSAAPALREVPLLVPLDLSQIDWTQRMVEAKLMTLLQCMEQWSSPVFGQFQDIPRTRWLLSFALPYEMEYEDCQGEQNLRCFPFETLLSQLATRLSQTNTSAVIMVGTQALKPDPSNNPNPVQDYGTETEPAHGWESHITSAGAKLCYISFVSMLMEDYQLDDLHGFDANLAVLCFWILPAFKDLEPFGSPAQVLEMGANAFDIATMSTVVVFGSVLVALFLVGHYRAPSGSSDYNHKSASYLSSIVSNSSAIDFDFVVYNLTQMIFSPFIGTLSDRVGRKRILIMALLGGAFVSFLQAKAENLTQMLVVRAVGGIAASSGPVETAYLMEESTSEKELREVLVLQRIVVTLGAILGPLVAKVFSHLSFQDLCYLIVASNIVGAFIGIFFYSAGQLSKVSELVSLEDTHLGYPEALVETGLQDQKSSQEHETDQALLMVLLCVLMGVSGGVVGYRDGASPESARRRIRSSGSSLSGNHLGNRPRPVGVGPGKASKKADDAAKLGTDLQKKGKDNGMKMLEAAGAITAAVAQIGKTGPDFIEALRSLGASWSEAAGLLAAGGSGGDSGPWGKAADLAKTASGKASGATLKAAMDLAKEVGASWTEKLTPITVADLSSSKTEDEAALKAAADAPQKITDTRQKAAALVKASLAQLQMESPQSEDALKNAKDALASFRELNVPEGEATALRAVAVASLGVDAFGALQAANQSLKTFKELGHGKGQVAALHSIAMAHLGKDSTDDCVFRAMEGLKLSRQVGDRMREYAILATIVEAYLIQGAGKRGLSSAQEALAVAKGLGEKLLEAKAQCLVAKAAGLCSAAESAAGVAAAQEALKMYQSMGLKSKESEALAALGAACMAKEDPAEALREGQGLADKFRQAGDKKEESSVMLAIAKIHKDSKELDQALRAAQEAVTCAKASNDRTAEAKALQATALIRLEKEEPGEALRAAEQACGLYRNQAFPSRASRNAEIACLKAMVDAQAAMGSADEGMRLASEQQRRYKSLKEKKGEGSAFLMMGKLHQLRGDLEEALNCLVQCPALFLAVGDRKGEGEAWLGIAKIHLGKGDVQQAQRAAEECALAYRKLGDKKGRAEAAQLVSDVHFALASIGQGNPQEALRAAQEAVQLYQELGEKTQTAISLHILANANLMTKNFDDALKTAQDSETAFRALRDTAGEAGSMMLQSGAHLGRQDFEEAKRCAKESRDLFKSAGDFQGEDSIEDFLDHVEGYEKGRQNLDDFRGFAMRRTDPTVAKGAGPKRERAPRKPRQISNISDIELIKMDSSKEGKVTLAFFDAFESRSAGGGKPPPKAEAGSKGPGGLALGAPEKEPVLYSVRWVQASAGKSGASPGPKKGRREFTKEEDKRLVSTASLGAPKDSFGPYGRSERLEAVSGKRGV
ncbi:mdtG [Symbiodinium necroappetens]|uniref:MdtG protein n=1 Tax=Symbiodinium necroappetens TaxID=1628268 RepID=A0A812Z218_9DINO|nr:mdtG [Symbiodinium necroappetens]